MNEVKATACTLGIFPNNSQEGKEVTGRNLDTGYSEGNGPSRRIVSLDVELTDDYKQGVGCEGRDPSREDYAIMPPKSDEDEDENEEDEIEVLDKEVLLDYIETDAKLGIKSRSKSRILRGNS